MNAYAATLRNRFAAALSTLRGFRLTMPWEKRIAELQTRIDELESLVDGMGCHLTALDEQVDELDREPVDFDREFNDAMEGFELTDYVDADDFAELVVDALRQRGPLELTIR